MLASPTSASLRRFFKLEYRSSPLGSPTSNSQLIARCTRSLRSAPIQLRSLGLLPITCSTASSVTSRTSAAATAAGLHGARGRFAITSPNRTSFRISITRQKNDGTKSGSVSRISWRTGSESYLRRSASSRATMTAAATTARVMISMMMKISPMEAIPAMIRSHLDPSAMSLNTEAVPAR